MSTIRWGVWGCGGISAAFCAGLKLLPDACIARVAARDQAKADSFAQKVGASAAGDYASLLEADDVDVVYVATTTAQHRDAVRGLLERGKAVLCEKPMTCSARDTAELIALARSRRVLLMEAMWTRFFPAMQEIRAWLDTGRIGQLRLLRGDFSINIPYDPVHRLYDRAVGGGAVLDVGVYPVAMSQWLLGTPTAVHTVGRVSPSGVDVQATLVLEHAQGGIASLTCGADLNGSHDLLLAGSAGHIVVPQAWYNAAAAELHAGGTVTRVQANANVYSNLYAYQAEHVMALVRARATESPVMPLADSQAIATTLDQAMTALGCAY